MKLTPGHWMVPLLPLGVGVFLIYSGTHLGWGAVWTAGGGFFVTVAVAAYLLNLAWIVPAPFGLVLRHPITNVAILLAVIGMLIVTVILGVFR